MNTLTTLETLGKLAAKKVEEKQVEIAELQKVMDEMTARREDIKKSIDTEYKTAQQVGDAQLMTMAGAYHARVEHELQDIKEAFVDAEVIMKTKRAELQERFAEQKRFELLLDRRKQELRKEQLKKEQAVMDELGAKPRVDF